MMKLLPRMIVSFGLLVGFTGSVLVATPAAAQIDDDAKASMLEGVMVDGEKLRFHSIESSVKKGRNHWYQITLKQGKNREIRRLLAAFDLQVNRLKRIAFGPIILPKTLLSGQLGLLDDQNLAKLMQACCYRPGESHGKAR